MNYCKQLFNIITIEILHHDPGVDSTSNRNEYQEYFLRGKGGRCVGLTTLPHSCTDCLQNLGDSNSWNPQGLSRPVQGLLYPNGRNTALEFSFFGWILLTWLVSRISSCARKLRRKYINTLLRHIIIYLEVIIHSNLRLICNNCSDSTILTKFKIRC